MGDGEGSGNIIKLKKVEYARTKLAFSDVYGLMSETDEVSAKES